MMGRSALHISEVLEGERSTLPRTKEKAVRGGGEAGLEVEAGKHGGATECEGRICLKAR